MNFHQVRLLYNFPYQILVFQPQYYMFIFWHDLVNILLIIQFLLLLF